MGSVICITSLKGGVGKTTTAVNLSTALALAEKRVLLVDADPQAHATGSIGLDRTVIKGSLRDAMTGRAPAGELIRTTEISFLDILPATRGLLGLDAAIAARRGKERILKEMLDQERQRRDFIVIDTPPTFGLLTVNAMVASDFLLIPLQCEYYALEGMPYLLDLIRLCKRHAGSDARVGGILLTLSDPGDVAAGILEKEVRDRFNGLVLQTVVPRDNRIRDSAFNGRPHLLQDIGSPGAIRYLALAREIIQRWG